MNMAPPVLAALLLAKILLVTLINEDLLINVNVSMSKARNMTLPLTATLLTKRLSLVVVSNETRGLGHCYDTTNISHIVDKYAAGNI